MGRRPGGTTKSGRFMNPADQERKNMRQKELKRNKKQRTAVRHAILKSKDVDEIIESLKRLDDQEFDVHVEHHSKYVFNEKRVKLKQTFSEVMNLYKQEKSEDKIKELVDKMDQYNVERARKIEQYNAQRFSLEANPVEIPLPDGSSLPNAAMTPVAPSIPAHYLMPQARAGILKHPAEERVVGEKGDPPGPPVGLPPILKTEEGMGGGKRKTVRFGDTDTKMIEDEQQRTRDDDYGPVDIPAEVMQEGGDQYSSVLMPQQPLVHAPPLPPNMLPPLPIRLPPPPPNFARPGMPGYGQASGGDSVISAAPMVRRPPERRVAEVDGAEATISAEPKLRDLTKEVTRFVPTALRARRTQKVVQKRPSNKFSVMGVQVDSAQRKEAKDTDEAYADFMKEVSSLL